MIHYLLAFIVKDLTVHFKQCLFNHLEPSVSPVHMKRPCAPSVCDQHISKATALFLNLPHILIHTQSSYYQSLIPTQLTLYNIYLFQDTRSGNLYIFNTACCYFSYEHPKLQTLPCVIYRAKMHRQHGHENSVLFPFILIRNRLDLLESVLVWLCFSLGLLLSFEANSIVIQQ